MKIVLSVEAIKYPLTGIGRYTYELAQRLGDLDDVEAVAFYHSGALIDHIPSAEEAVSSSINNPGLVNRIKRILARSTLVVDAYRLYKSLVTKNVLDDFSDHIYHGPNFYLPSVKGPSVVTIHDISFLTYPQFHPKERVVVLKKEVESALKRATKIITDSNFIREEIIDYFGLEEDRVKVAMLASDDSFYPRKEAEIADMLAEYDLGYQAYALYTGTIEPRKNLANLIDAYGRLPENLRHRYPLVMAGYKGWNNQAIMERIQAAEAEGWLKYLGYVPNEHLPLLYSGARLFTFPSIYEGFGLPVLEAMASGVPVMTSDRASLPEVGGDAVAYVDPEDLGSIAKALETGLADQSWREDAIKKGLVQAGSFSWDKCAADTAHIYREAIAAFR